VDLRDPQPRYALLGSAFEFARGKMRRPHLGGYEYVVTLDPGRTQAVAHFAFVVVHFRRVDVAITEAERLLDHPRARAPTQLPGAEPDDRNACAVGGDRRRRCDLRHGLARSVVPPGRMRR